ncbi:hypothetical protein GDO81_008775 [Engystomops pustulosus]|uniref:Uncharacterized protein n=1 Tax=Engystomops pustulosus TaxID=76066 RepID=A0AAV7CJ53_ENGPU|nr:hypothetical protein GDO81_008775 [Engystomops pustulosus]
MLPNSPSPVGRVSEDVTNAGTGRSSWLLFFYTSAPTPGGFSGWTQEGKLKDLISVTTGDTGGDASRMDPSWIHHEKPPGVGTGV